MARPPRPTTRVDGDMNAITYHGETREFATISADWKESLNAGIVLERNDCSRLHSLKRATLHGGLYWGAFEGLLPNPEPEILECDQTFVIKHNWAAALSGSEADAGPVRLPFDRCAFEFRLNGRSVIGIATEFQALTEKLPSFFRMPCFVQFGEHWAHLSLGSFPFDQVRAICIALEAEVAMHSVVRASVSLNAKRAKVGKVALIDFHTVDLSRRARISNPVSASHGGTKIRLHFRRGHWRHFETTKTWIRWCLVGDPDIGFIQKDYSL